LAEEITFFRGDSIDFPTFAMIGKFDSRKVVKMANDEDSGGVKLLKEGFGVSDGGLFVDAMSVE